MKSIQLYHDSIIELARSLIIKSEVIARAMNRPLLEAGITVSSNKATWRYYLNLAGLKHSADKPILVTSFDTGELIEYNQEVLTTHKKTQRAYRDNRDMVGKLILTYPELAVFVVGVVRPVPLQVSIEADDCTILGYDGSLVESQEDCLITDLAKWLRAMHHRFYYEGWEATQAAFTTSFWNMLYPQIPAKIKSFRLANIHTPSVHSFHIEKYLASHQRLHVYLPYLTLKQKMFLYRNIRYIERHLGTEDIFVWLVENLPGKGMPTFIYDVGQRIHDDPDNRLTPYPIGYKDTVLDRNIVSGRDIETVPVDDIINKQIPLAYDNLANATEYRDELNRALSYTQYPDQPTKLVEVTAIDPDDYEMYRLDSYIINQWIYMCGAGLYDISHDILDPVNGTPLVVRTNELLAIFLYAALRGYSGVSLVDIPDMHALSIQRNIWFDKSEYDLIMPTAHTGRWDSLVGMYVDTNYTIDTYINTTADFYYHATALLDIKRARHRYGNGHHLKKERVAAELAFKLNYRNIKCDLKLPDTSYEALFRRVGLDTEKISDDGWQDIAIEALRSGTGYSSQDHITVSDRQAAIVRLMEQLSSYSIHYAKSYNTDKTIVTGPAAAISDVVMQRAKGSVQTITPLTTVSGSGTRIRILTPVTHPATKIIGVRGERVYTAKLRISVSATVSATNTVRLNVPLPTIGVSKISRANVPDKNSPLTIQIQNTQLDGFISGPVQLSDL